MFVFKGLSGGSKLCKNLVDTGLDFGFTRIIIIVSELSTPNAELFGVDHRLVIHFVRELRSLGKTELGIFLAIAF